METPKKEAPAEQAEPPMTEVDKKILGQIGGMPMAWMLGIPALFATAVPFLFQLADQLEDLGIVEKGSFKIDVAFLVFLYVYFLVPLLYIAFQGFRVRLSRILTALVVFVVPGAVVSWILHDPESSLFFGVELLLLLGFLALAVLVALERQLGWLHWIEARLRRKSPPPVGNPGEVFRGRGAYLVLTGVVFLGLVVVRRPPPLPQHKAGYYEAFDEVPEYIKGVTSFRNDRTATVEQFSEELRLADLRVRPRRVIDSVSEASVGQAIGVTDRFLQQVQPMLDPDSASVTSRDTIIARFEKLNARLKPLLKEGGTPADDTLLARLNKDLDRLQKKFKQNLSSPRVRAAVRDSILVVEGLRSVLAQEQRAREVRLIGRLSHHVQQRYKVYQAQYAFAQAQQAIVFRGIQMRGWLIFGLALAILIVFYLRHNRVKTDELDERQQAQRAYDKKTYQLGIAMIIFLGLPLLQPIDADNIVVERPMSSFTQTNWYLPQFVQQAVAPKPRPPSVSQPMTVQGVDLEARQLRQELEEQVRYMRELLDEIHEDDLFKILEALDREKATEHREEIGRRRNNYYPGARQAVGVRAGQAGSQERR